MLEAGGREEAGERGPRPAKPQNRVRSWDKHFSSKGLEGDASRPLSCSPLSPRLCPGRAKLG